jgi:hypothetical protein
MKEPHPMTTETARRRRPSTQAMTAKVTAIAVGAAIALTGGLAIQMAAGHDPALATKAKRQASAGSPAPGSSSGGSSTSGQSSGGQADATPAQVVTRTS